MTLNFNRNGIIRFFVLALCTIGKAQIYAPPAGQAGTTAMYKDSSSFVNWAKNCFVSRGYQDVSNPSLGFASAGDSSMATGKAQTNGIVSLGDGGFAICAFEKPIKNGPGADLAVFENSFNDTFLELAFVEVSSDGVNFFRFPSHSLSDTVNQYDNAAIMDATKLNNLAGKYRAGYGTPFDLQELAGNPALDINAITHVKIIDVVGSLMRAYATHDSFGNKINDPWTTPFPSSGFDLDAIGVIHENTATTIIEAENESSFILAPNPTGEYSQVVVKTNLKISSFEVIDYSGKTIQYGKENEISPASLSKGTYLVKFYCEPGNTITRILVVDK